MNTDDHRETLVRRLLASSAALFLVACAGNASAQVAGQLGNAVPLAVNQHVFGGFLAVAQHQAEGLGQLRMSFYPGLDFGFQGGLHRYDGGGASRTAVELGGDLRTSVARSNAGSPFDVSLGGAIQLSSADHRNVLGIGPTAAVSRTYTLDGGREWSPYFGAALLYSRTDAGGSNVTDMSLPLRAGVDFRPNADMRMVLELQLPVSDPGGAHPKIMLGANFPF
jgi:hypothetical protein